MPGEMAQKPPSGKRSHVAARRSAATSCAFRMARHCELHAAWRPIHLDETWALFSGGLSS
jgi:hypothetical protein